MKDSSTKKLLILSFYAPPLNGVSSYRIDSFVKDLSSLDFDVTLVTRHWKESFENWDDILVSNNKAIECINITNRARVHYLPFKQKIKDHSNKLINTFAAAFNYLKGNIQPELDFYYQYKDFCDNLVKNENFDMILVSAPPNNMVRIGYFLNRKYKVPFVIDYRDFFNNQFLVNNPKLKFSQVLLNRISQFYLKRWTKHASFIISVSPQINQICNKIFNKECYLITNGFVEDFCDKNLFDRNEIFTIRYIGTAYAFQDFSIIIAGLNKFLKEERDKKIRIEIIGLNSEKIENIFKQNYTPDILTVIKRRIPIKDVIVKTKCSDVLLLPWNNFSGVYGTKVFDYVASGSHILLSPSDNNLVEDLIKETKSGTICNNLDEVYNFLIEEYNKWLNQSNKIELNDTVYKYSRKNISIKLNRRLMELIDANNT